jgi:hypothetical protein
MFMPISTKCIAQNYASAPPGPAGFAANGASGAMNSL